MLQCRGDADLAEEALGAERGGDLGPEGLDRDLPTVLQVAGEQDPRHPATTDFPFDRVALAQRTLQERDEVTHGLLRHNTAECLGWLPVPKWFTRCGGSGRVLPGDLSAQPAEVIELERKRRHRRPTR